MAEQKLEVIRHSLAHIMAAAVQKLHPEAQFGVGPVVENGFYYDMKLNSTLKPEDLKAVEKEMRAIIGSKVDFEREDWDIDKAIEYFADHKQPFKVELLNDLKTKGSTAVADAGDSDLVDVAAKVTTVSVYKTGNFVDLCRGPHVKNTGDIDANGFKLTKISGAYWRGNEDNPQLQRIYGVAFEDKDQLQKNLQMLEEAEKRDHRKLSEQLGIYMLSPVVGAGLPLMLPRGEKIKAILKDYMRQKEESLGYKYVSTPVLAHEELYKQSGHADYYTDDMFSLTDSEGQRFYIKPMNCPHHHQIYKKLVTSYRDLPLKLAEDDGLYRHELSGTLTGLIRVRGPITQNDAHIYVTEQQCEEEFGKFIDLFKEVYKEVGIKDYWFRLSLPDFKKDKFVGKKSTWENASNIIRKVLKDKNVDFVEAEGEAAFYGPKADIQVKNVLGKEDTIATCQVDILVPHRMGLKYVDEEGEEKAPLIIHRAILGSYERFMAFMIEQTAGVFPLWLAPEQVRVLPISEKFVDYAQSISSKLKENGVRHQVDDSSESLGKRIRNAELMKVPYVVVVGEKEQESKTVAVRKYGQGDLGSQSVDEFVTTLLKNTSERSLD
ncbi:threonine--tRNA ligase [Candidatus Saccharibacteria bacterium]|nr:threonine--tRNA ligase [Candidatus Saccharibacteria bacterium]